MSRVRSSLTLQSTILAGSAVLAQVVFALLVTLVARDAGPAGFGFAASALGIGGFLTGLLDYGFTSYSLRELAAGRMAPGAYWDRLRTKLVAGLLGTGGLVAVGFALSRPQLGGMVGLLVVSRTLLLGVAIPLRATHRVGRAAAVALAEKLSWLAWYVILVNGLSVEPLAGFWWSMGIGTVVAAATGLATVNGAVTLLSSARLRSPWTGEAGYGVFSLAVSLSMLDVALLGAASGGAQAGAYGAVSRWTQPVLLVSQSFSAAATPFVAGARSSRAAFVAIWRSLWIPGLSLAACLAMMVLAPLVVPVLLGPAYRYSAPIVAILAGGAAAVVVSQPLATFLAARGYARLVGGATMVTVVLQLSGVLLTARPLGAIGAAIAYTVTQLLLLMVLSAGAALITVRCRRTHRPPIPRAAISDVGQADPAGIANRERLPRL